MWHRCHTEVLRGRDEVERFARVETGLELLPGLEQFAAPAVQLLVEPAYQRERLVCERLLARGFDVQVRVNLL